MPALQGSRAAAQPRLLPVMQASCSERVVAQPESAPAAPRAGPLAREARVAVVKDQIGQSWTLGQIVRAGRSGPRGRIVGLSRGVVIVEWRMVPPVR